jgi:flagellin-specific chaperone FliS
MRKAIMMLYSACVKCISAMQKGIQAQRWDLKEDGTLFS